MKKKIVCLLLTLTLSCFSLTGCYSTRGLETLAYAVAIGIDKGDGNNKLKVTLQLAVLSDSSSDGGGSTQSQQSTITSVDCSSIDSGISLINSYISKKVNLSHCKAVVFSEEFAYDGLSEELFTLINNLEIRPDCNIIISRCNALDYLQNVQPTLESVSARYYELILNSSEYTAYSQNIALKDFYNSLLNSSSSPYAILGGINNKSTQELSTTSSIYDSEGSYKADEAPIISPNGIENMGLAVFSGDKLVGELNGAETLSHIIVTNNLKSAIITIPNPYKQGSVISVYITQAKKTKNSLKFVNNCPYITCDISINGNVLSLEEVDVKVVKAKLDSKGNKVTEKVTSKNGKEYLKVVKEETTEKRQKDMPSRLNARKKIMTKINKVKDSDGNNIDLTAKLFGEIAEKYKDRVGGYTQIIKVGARKGDNAEKVILKLV